MPPLVTTRSPVLRLASISWSFFRCCDCGRRTRKYQMAKRGAKKTSNCVSAPAVPGSAARRIGFEKKHSIKGRAVVSKIYGETPVREVRGFLVRGFPDSLQDCIAAL